MTNGSVEIANSLLDKAGVKDIMAAVIDVSEPQAWKPAAAAYLHAVETLILRPEEVGSDTRVAVCDLFTPDGASVWPVAPTPVAAIYMDFSLEQQCRRSYRSPGTHGASLAHKERQVGWPQCRRLRIRSMRLPL